MFSWFYICKQAINKRDGFVDYIKYATLILSIFQEGEYVVK